MPEPFRSPRRAEGLTVSPEMEALVGRPFAAAVSEPIAARDVRRWHRAVMWPQQPPDADAERVPLDYNPFAWGPTGDGRPPDGEAPDSFIEGRAGVAGPGSTSGVNGELDVTYGVPMQIGDVVTTVSRVTGYRIREGTGRRLLLTDVETEWRNQDGEIVLVQRNTTVRW